MSHSVHWEELGIVRRFWGRVAATEVLQSVSEVQVDPRLSEMRYLLDDCLAVRDGCFRSDTPVERKKLLQLLASTLDDDAYRAIVVDLTHADQARKWMRSLPETRYQAGVFTSLVDARDWLAAKTASLRPAVPVVARHHIGPPHQGRTAVLYLVDRVAQVPASMRPQREQEEKRYQRSGWANSA